MLSSVLLSVPPAPENRAHRAVPEHAVERPFGRRRRPSLVAAQVAPRGRVLLPRVVVIQPANGGLRRGEYLLGPVRRAARRRRRRRRQRIPLGRDHRAPRERRNQEREEEEEAGPPRHLHPHHNIRLSATTTCTRTSSCRFFWLSPCAAAAVQRGSSFIYG